MAKEALVKEFTTEEVTAWANGLGESIPDLVQICLWVCIVLGFLVFGIGLYKYAKERKDAMDGGGRGDRQGLVMVFVGAGLGSLGLIFLVLVAILRPS